MTSGTSTAVFVPPQVSEIVITRASETLVITPADGGITTGDGGYLNVAYVMLRSLVPRDDTECTPSLGYRIYTGWLPVEAVLLPLSYEGERLVGDLPGVDQSYLPIEFRRPTDGLIMGLIGGQVEVTMEAFRHVLVFTGTQVVLADEGSGLGFSFPIPTWNGVEPGPPEDLTIEVQLDATVAPDPGCFQSWSKWDLEDGSPGPCLSNMNEGYHDWLETCPKDALTW